MEQDCSMRGMNRGILYPDIDVPWLRRLMAGLSLRMPGFDPRSVRVRLWWTLTLGQIFLRILRLSSVSIIPPIGTCSSLSPRFSYQIQKDERAKPGIQCGCMSKYCMIGNICSQASTGGHWGWRYIGVWLYPQVTCLADMPVVVTLAYWHVSLVLNIAKVRRVILFEAHLALSISAIVFEYGPLIVEFIIYRHC